MNEEQVKAFWESHPCGDKQIGGLESFGSDYQRFFKMYDEFRYGEYPELPKLLGRMGFNNSKVLEIGLGEGADSEQIIRNGGEWSGLDLTAESIARVGTRLRIRQLPYVGLKQGTVLDPPFGSNSFDKVYSCGVLHHVPEVKKAAKQIHRVLKSDGELIVMLYAKVSLNYLFSILIFRRLLLVGAYLVGMQSTEKSKLSQHIENAKESGLFNYSSFGLGVLC